MHHKHTCNHGSCTRSVTPSRLARPTVHYEQPCFPVLLTLTVPSLGSLASEAGSQQTLSLYGMHQQHSQPGMSRLRQSSGPAAVHVPAPVQQHCRPLQPAFRHPRRSQQCRIQSQHFSFEGGRMLHQHAANALLNLLAVSQQEWSATGAPENTSTAAVAFSTCIQAWYRNMHHWSQHRRCTAATCSCALCSPPRAFTQQQITRMLQGNCCTLAPNSINQDALNPT